MCQAFRTYVDQLEDATTEHHLREALAAVAGNFDLTNVAYIILPRGKRPPMRLITNYPPPWAAHYVANGYQNADPVLSQSRIVTTPFDWKPGFANDNDFTRRFFCEASDYGIRFGRTIPIHNRRGLVAAVTFATDRHCPTFCATVERNADTLELVALYFHAYVCRKLGIVQDVHLTERERQCLY